MTNPIFREVHYSLPTILCLHGHGTSGAIFEAQTRNIRQALRAQYKFVYIDAPHESEAGPGVYPVFEDAGPFYSWFSKPTISEPDIRETISSKAKELAGLGKYVETQLAERNIKTSDVVAVMGFSQGTIVASLLLLQAQWRDARWGNLRFGILLSGACREDFVSAFTGQKLKIPTVHVHGLEDPFLKSSRMLTREVFHPNSANVLEFNGGHHIPRRPSDLGRLTMHIRDLNKKSKAQVVC
jgi:predicted esterase